MSNETLDTSAAADLTRRAFVVGGLAAGFALSVQPVAADTITTDTTGLIAGEVKIKGPDGVAIPAYRALPQTGYNLPVVLVVQEIFGVHEHIRDVCRRLAKQGYFAIAPELFARQGDVSQAKDFNEIRPIVAKVPDAQVMDDLDAAVHYVRMSGRGGDAKKLAITGFCWGGRIVWLYAAHNPTVKAGVAWYGRLVSEPTDLQPRNPIDVAATLTVPVLGLYAGKDQGIPIASVDRMRETLKTGISGSEINVYPDASHGFHADYRPSYSAEEARDGWARMLAWFKTHGAA